MWWPDLATTLTNLAPTPTALVSRELKLSAEGAGADRGEPGGDEREEPDALEGQPVGCTTFQPVMPNQPRAVGPDSAVVRQVSHWMWPDSRCANESRR